MYICVEGECRANVLTKDSKLNQSESSGCFLWVEKLNKENENMQVGKKV